MRRNRIERTRPGKAASVIATALVLLLGTLSPAAVTAKPRALTASEMDGVTAGGIRVDAIAFAQASGDFALAQTRSDALVGTINQRDFGMGFAEGLAFACCGPESDVTVHSSVSSTGEIIFSKTDAVTFRGAISSRGGQVSYFIYGYTAAFLVAWSTGDRPDYGHQAGREAWDHLGGSISALIDVSQTLGRDGVVTGFEFAPAFAVGLRWHLLREFLGATPTGSTPAMAGLRPSPARFLQASRTPFGLIR
jgi:hypothetical protein